MNSKRATIIFPSALVLLALAAMFCASVFLAVGRHSHSVSDTLYDVFPFWVPALRIVAWIASRTQSI